MKIATIIGRVLLGLMLIVFGLNSFIQFMPMPEMPAEAGEFMGAMAKTGYLFPIIAVVEIVTGLFILLNKYMSLALVILFPVMLNAFLFHIFLDMAGIGAAALALSINTFLLVVNRDKFNGIFQMI